MELLTVHQHLLPVRQNRHQPASPDQKAPPDSCSALLPPTKPIGKRVWREEKWVRGFKAHW